MNTSSFSEAGSIASAHRLHRRALSAAGAGSRRRFGTTSCTSVLHAAHTSSVIESVSTALCRATFTYSLSLVLAGAS